MKFGKHLQKSQLDIPEYATSFVNYKELKKLIKQLSRTPVLLPQNALRGAQVVGQAPEAVDAKAALQANKVTFFFKVERELEKVNAFYLQKEAELKLRLKTLLDKKRVMQSKRTIAFKVSASFVALQEGFQQFGNDLNKLQQFVEINATAFSKILKKWDKTAKSRTKELYLSRAVEVQPCFNRDVISDLSDKATTSLLELEAWAEGENIQYDTQKRPDHIVSGQSLGTEENDTDLQLLRAATSGNNAALKDWVKRLGSSRDAKERFTRAFLAAIPESPIESLEILLESRLVDVLAEDEINERNCLHEAAICGRREVLLIGLSKGVDPCRMDVYGRLPLHYASMHGQVSMLDDLMSKAPETVNSQDQDNYTPLIHAIVHHNYECAHELLRRGARIDPESETDHAPLNLACQHGSINIVQLLLEKSAKLVPDAEGLYPQHLVARQGQTPQILLLLEKHGASLNQLDKIYQWTPLFHAASEGHVECVKVLLDHGVDSSIKDEKGLSAMYYATWEGHLECMKLLNESSSGVGLERPAIVTNVYDSADRSDHSPDAMDADGIPDLSLPPPILPLRRYGHNFLDTKAFIQITFETNGANAILFYNDSKHPASRLTVSSKFSDNVPRNIMIPIQEEHKTVTFHVDSSSNFTVEFDIYPNFGTKVIARTVALPTVFSADSSSCGRCSLPLFDPRLKPIGQISFYYQVIKPFRGIPLEIAQFETYWKATSQIDSHPNTLITGSSLSGDFVQLFIQLTGDGVPVLCPKWTLPYHGVTCTVGRMKFEEFRSLAPKDIATVLDELSNSPELEVADVHRLLASSHASLKEVLSKLPKRINVALQVLYPSADQERSLGLGPSLNMNDYVDAILTDVFDHARMQRQEAPDFMRSIILLSYNPDTCTALNWKQPNYPVILCNDLVSPENFDSPGSYQPQCDGHRSMSVKDAVRVAQSNNFMGLMCTSRLLKAVPALIESIRVAGLVLVTDTTSEGTGFGNPRARSFEMPEGVDGILKEGGTLRFNETIDM